MATMHLMLLCASLAVAHRVAAVQHAVFEGLLIQKAPYPVAGPKPGKYIEPKPVHLKVQGLLYVGVPPLLATLAAFLVSSIGYLGFRYPDATFVVCGPLWGSYLLTNLVHLIAVANAANMYFGLGRWVWLLLPASLGTLGIYLLWERSNRRVAQNFITAFTSAFGAVSAVSVILSYFCMHKNSPFDLVSFMTYPTGFRWSDPADVAMLIMLIVLVIGGMGVSTARDARQESHGFGEDREGTLGIAKKMARGSYDSMSRAFSTGSIDAKPFLSFASFKSDRGGKQQLMTFNWPASRREQHMESADDTDTKDGSTDDESLISLHGDLGDVTPTTSSSVKVLCTSKELLDEYDACFSSVPVAETEDFCTFL
ncbi:hypothetical protein BESB_060080 [Besnoitia besnoiti]|uniref:Transmembrane protein n=1 Tax=Besnoitia besnoiti TaxID=94643 RepID=A0A2A9MFT9_BESBE|nr:hypothetical protein BESB_060080 [Besnoitia besnoiti]PFH35121.1 hypothetical protein BESB_060080 [Besnoitia besnoiti]